METQPWVQFLGEIDTRFSFCAIAALCLLVRAGTFSGISHHYIKLITAFFTGTSRCNERRQSC